MSELSKYILAVIDEYKAAGSMYCEIASRQERIRIETYTTEGVGFVTLLPRPITSKPALEAEEKFGLKGVSQRYKMPDGLSEDDLEVYLCLLVHAQRRNEVSCTILHKALAETWNILETKNPELRQLGIDKNDAVTVSEAVFGVTSAFKVDDIAFYLSLKGDWMSKHDEQDYGALYSRVCLHVELGWIPSAETLDSIARQIVELKIPTLEMQSLRASFPQMPQPDKGDRTLPAAPERKRLGGGGAAPKRS